MKTAATVKTKVRAPLMARRTMKRFSRLGIIALAALTLSLSRSTGFVSTASAAPQPFGSAVAECGRDGNNTIVFQLPYSVFGLYSQTPGLTITGVYYLPVLYWYDARVGWQHHSGTWFKGSPGKFYYDPCSYRQWDNDDGAWECNRAMPVGGHDNEVEFKLATGITFSPVLEEWRWVDGHWENGQWVNAHWSHNDTNFPRCQVGEL